MNFPLRNKSELESVQFSDISEKYTILTSFKIFAFSNFFYYAL